VGELKKGFYISLAFTFSLWIIKLLEIVFNVSFSSFGIFPGTLSGFFGILFSPFIHGDLVHLFSNTVPLIVLGTGLIYLYPSSSRIVIPSIYILGGLGVWLFARPAMHIGASGLVYGFAVFIFFSGIFRRDARAMALSLIVVFLYGGMIWGILPLKSGVSFESHLSSSVVGFFLAFLFRKRDILPFENDRDNDYFSDEDFLDDNT